MKKFVFLFLIAGPSGLLAQEKLNSLRSPTSPASSVLGVQPSSVLSPKSFQALEATLFSNYLNTVGSNSVPNDFGLEFSPYWAKNHGLSLEQYLYPDKIQQQWLRNSTFSLATSQNFILGDSSSSNGIALGYRTQLFFGNGNDRDTVSAYIQKLNELHSIRAIISSQAEDFAGRTNSLSEFLDSLRFPVVTALYKTGNFTSRKEADKLVGGIFRSMTTLKKPDKKDRPATEKFLDSFYNRIDTRLNLEDITSRFESYIKERQGFSIDGALAGLLNFPSNRFDFSYMPRYSLWITPTYRLSGGMHNLKALLVYRFEWYNTDYYKAYFPSLTVYSQNTDYGLAVSGEFEKISFQLEAVGRKSRSEIPAGKDSQGNELFRKEKKSDFQYLGSFSYNLKDQIVITYTLGNRFDPILNPGNTLVSMLSLNFGFGGPTLQK